MNSNHHAKARLTNLVQFAEANHPRKNRQAFIDFLCDYYSQVSAEDLAVRSLGFYYEVAKWHWGLIEKKRKAPVIAIMDAKVGDSSHIPHTVIGVVATDMPFMVDSLRMALQRLGIRIHLTVQLGGIVTKRNKEKQLTAVHMDVDCTRVPEGKGVDYQGVILFEIEHLQYKDQQKELIEVFKSTLQDVTYSVQDWSKMQQKLDQCIEYVKEAKALCIDGNIDEAVAYLEWLKNNHFTFLGYREYEVVNHKGEKALSLVQDSGLGVLRESGSSRKIRLYSELPKEAQEIALSSGQILIISKTNTRSTVHRPAYTDYIGIKVFNAKGEIVGERRFIGLYTSNAYTEDPSRIPFLREKVAYVLTHAKLPKNSYEGKVLEHILANFPRDDLMHADVDELRDIAMGILHLQERRMIRLFTRQDQYGRYVSAMVYLPRDNFNTDVNRRLQALLKEYFNTKEVAVSTYFSESPLVRISFHIRVNAKHPVTLDNHALEKRVIEICRAWRDIFYDNMLELFGEADGKAMYERYAYAFPDGYREFHAPRKAVHDIKRIERLLQNASQRDLEVAFFHRLGAQKNTLQLKLYHLEQPVLLSDAVPLLETMGFKVISEQSFTIQVCQKIVWLSYFNLELPDGGDSDLELYKKNLELAFAHIWQEEAECDLFNALLIRAHLSWREIAVLRAYAKYMQQIGSTYSQAYIERTILNNPGLASLLVQLFCSRFDPALPARDKCCKKIKKQIKQALQEVKVLDEDRIFSLFVDLILATVRTNYYQLGASGAHKKYLSFKLNPRMIPGVPLPVPQHEIFVYSPRFEGVHLRTAKVARGGLRWSDRREDFRTEVLGLMKAQQVKNALIVPAGAKGGFVPKLIDPKASREQAMAEAIACYQSFINGLLDLTDNIVNNEVTYQDNTVRYDDNDSYLVVAADKGTATFSDIANAISVDRGYWLGDAFASGGATGYDHKKLGITARGAWVSVERHFLEMGVDVNTQEITVVGIGDMAGDVFGNGLLSSKHIKLVAAFNHMHIFIDPNPDCAVSYKERKRLFNLPRSTWQDYNPELISQGGGVYSRTAKAISLTPEVRKLLGVSSKVLEPNQLIQAILKAQVDLLWNGGIGTYVKAQTEQNSDVGDRSNDALRVDGKELRCKVVGEGGNLGFTQQARVEYAKRDGRVNTDFLDNSAGVDCSDHEVNAKIFLDKLVDLGKLSVKSRNDFLCSMADEVCQLVLHDNYTQNLSVSIAFHNSAHQMEMFSRFIQFLQSEGWLNPKLEHLPSEAEMLSRITKKRGLTRPELAVLLSYSKLYLKQKILTSDLVSSGDPAIKPFLAAAFPPKLLEKYGNLLQHHPLHQEIIATQLAGFIVSVMGITFVFRLQEEMDVAVADIVRAFLVVYQVLELKTIIEGVRKLEHKVAPELQYEVYSQAVRVCRRSILWLLRNKVGQINIEKTIKRYQEPVAKLYSRMTKLLVGQDKLMLEQHINYYSQKGLPIYLVERISIADPMFQCFSIVEAQQATKEDLFRTAKIYFSLVDNLKLLWLRNQLNNYNSSSEWSVLAKAGLKMDLDYVHRALAVKVIQDKSIKAKSALGVVSSWLEQHKNLVLPYTKVVASFKGQNDLGVDLLIVAIRKLMVLADQA